MDARTAKTPTTTRSSPQTLRVLPPPHIAMRSWMSMGAPRERRWIQEGGHAAFAGKQSSFVWLGHCH
jgi:hypothetical protein